MLRLEARIGTSRPYDLNVDGFSHTNKKLPDFIPNPNTADLSMQFFFTRGKYRNRVCKRLFRAVGKFVQVLHVQTTPAHQLTMGWWKVALLSLPALGEVRVSADFQTMLNFCHVLSNLTITHPNNYPRLTTIDVTKTPAYLLRHRYSAAVFEEHRLLSVKIAESIVALVERLKEVDAGLPLLSVDVDYHEWPGWVEARRIAPSVGSFKYSDTEVYNYSVLKANHSAYRARRMEIMKDVPEYEELRYEEFDD